MLRVRPILHTPHATEWAALLTALGLRELRVPAGDLASGLGVAAGRCLAADAGRILLVDADTFGIRLGFEVRDVLKFAQWTIGDGTPVRMRTEGVGHMAVEVADIVAPDGTAFDARPVDPLHTDGTPGPGGPAAGGTAVVAHWGTTDVAGAESTLANIGAKTEAAQASGDGETSRYRAKHGGYVEVRASGEPTLGLHLEYAGTAADLERRLALAGFDVRLPGGGRHAVLSVAHPDSGRLRVTCTGPTGNSAPGEQVAH
ncbi:hypothetical protein ACSYDW_16055 [Paeniglutamicibacter sp. R2-26]|uniref:hypothetical protein n=1 Tax=Paeniglutamicibacter sp. R2-26 TaxID=3144417 RepID=UPI003EE796D1